MGKEIFLFDMDGTLTPPRKRIDSKVVSKLRELSEHCEIGVVTGSDFEYLFQQCEDMFGIGAVPCDRVHLFPCNGTKYYRWGNGKRFHLIHNADMISEIGREDYNYLLQSLFSYQLMLSVTYDLPYTGTFFHYRGSMLNWCPIGRLAGDNERDAWINVDTDASLRKQYLSEIEKTFKEKNIMASAALGGSTSIDIFPEGWDKTYVLNHLSDYDSILFVGDKCEEGGNDFSLYTHLQENSRSFKTGSPEETIEIVDNFLRRSSEK